MVSPEKYERECELMKGLSVTEELYAAAGISFMAHNILFHLESLYDGGNQVIPNRKRNCMSHVKEIFPLALRSPFLLFLIYNLRIKLK